MTVRFIVRTVPAFRHPLPPRLPPPPPPAFPCHGTLPVLQRVYDWPDDWPVRLAYSTTGPIRPAASIGLVAGVRAPRLEEDQLPS